MWHSQNILSKVPIKVWPVWYNPDILFVCWCCIPTVCLRLLPFVFIMFCIMLYVCIFVCILNFALDSCIFHFLRLPLCWLHFICCHVCGDVCCSEYRMVKCTYVHWIKTTEVLYFCKISWVLVPSVGTCIRTFFHSKYFMFCVLFYGVCDEMYWFIFTILPGTQWGGENHL